MKPHQNPSHQGWQWLLSWMGLAGTPLVFLALLLLAGLSSGAKAQTTYPTVSPTEIYEGETLTFTIVTDMTNAGGLGWHNDLVSGYGFIDNHNDSTATEGATTGDFVFLASNGSTQNQLNSDDVVIRNNQTTNEVDIRIRANTDNTTEGDETIILELIRDFGTNIKMPTAITLKDGARPSTSTDGVTISETSLTLTELGASSAVEKTYTVVLNTDPTADVTITVANGDSTAVAVDTNASTSGNQNTLTFTAGGDGSGSGAGNGNWAVAQTVTVRALNDADGAPETFNLTHTATATGSTAPYHGISIDPVAITTTDVGHGTLVSTPTLSVLESDDEADYKLVLRSAPGGTVTISATSGATATATVSPPSLSFDNSNWDTPQRFTVTGKGAGSTSISHAVTTGTTDYPMSMTISSVAVTVTADTRPTVSLGPRFTLVDEGDNAVSTLTLSAALGVDVTIPMTVTNTNTESGDYTVPNPSSVTVTAGETEATFTVATTDDNLVETRELFNVDIDTTNLPGEVRAGTETTSQFAITDNDEGVLVSMSAAAASVWEGESLEVFFELAETLDKDVQIPIDVFGDATDIVDPVAEYQAVDYTATIAEGDTTGSVTVTTIQDTYAEQQEIFSVSLNNDGFEQLLSQGLRLDPDAATTQVTILDDDLVVLTESSGSTVVNEDGTTDGYEVHLRPLHGTFNYSPSTVVATAGDGVQVSASGNTPAASRSMTLSNLNRSRTVRVHAVDDDLDNPGGSRSGRITHAVTLTSDGTPNGVVDDILVTITDDDPTTVTLSAAAGDIEEGQTKEFTITLGRGLVNGETLTAPLTFGGTATRGTDYTMTGSAATGVQYNNLNSGNANVVFTGPQSGATATTATITLSATADSTVESTAETVDIAFGTVTNTGLTGAGGVSDTDNLAEFNISDAGPGAGVTASTNSLSLTELGAASLVEKTYTIVLDTDPGADVTITVANGDSTAVEVDTDSGTTGNQSTMTFTAGGDGSGSGAGNGNWAVAQTVTVRALNDADVLAESFNLTHSATATGNTAPYHGITIVPVAVTTTDAGHGVVVSKPSVSVAENDEMETYTVVLKSQPGGPVTITPTTDAMTTATVSPTSVTFTNSDWNMPKTFTVTGKGAGSTSISHEVTTGTTDYPTSTTIPAVAVTAVSSVSLPYVSPTELYEGERVKFTITISAEDGMQWNSSLDNDETNTTFLGTARASVDYDVIGRLVATRAVRDGNNYTLPVTISARTDNLTEGDETIIIGMEAEYPDYENVATVAITLKDGPRPAAADRVVVTPTSLTLTELGSPADVEKTYTVVLDTNPTADVTITVANGDATAVVVDTDSGTTGDQSTLTFTAGGDGSGSGVGNGNWATAQTVTVRALNDGDALAESFNLTHTATATGSTAPYHGITIDPVAITTIDAGHGVVVSESSVSVAENDETAAYTVVLKSQPGGTVTISAGSSATTRATVSPTSLSFTDSDWNMPKAFTVTGKDMGFAAISHGVSTGTTDYPISTRIPAMSVTVTAAVDAGLVITETGIPEETRVTEWTGIRSRNTDTYTVALATQPTHGVTVTASAGAGVQVAAPGGTAGGTATLTFTTSNWNTAQTVTVTGVDDSVDNPGGSREVTISHAASSTDSDYTIGSAGSVEVMVTDNESTNITLSANPAGDIQEGETKELTFELNRGLVNGETLELNLRLSGTAIKGTDYTMTNTAAAGLGVTYSNLSGTGNPSVNFTGPESGVTATTARITLTAITDSTVEDPESVLTATSSSANPIITDLYLGGGLGTTDNMPDFNILEAIPPGLTFSKLTLTVSEDGTTTTDAYTVALTTQPTHDVTVTVSAGAGVQVAEDEGTAGGAVTLTFTTSNWNTPQTVTVTGVNDSTDNPGGGREVSITHAASSTDSDYTIGSAGSVEATVTDDDATTVTLSGAAGDIQEGQTKEFTITLNRGLVDGETLTVPLTFGGTATRGTDYTMMGATVTGVQYNNLNSGTATVVFTGPQSGATATTATITLSATADNTVESTAETVDIGLGAITNTGLTGAGGVSETDSLAEFNISDAGPGAGVTVSTNSLSLTELGAPSVVEKTYTIVLDTNPGAAVTITVTNGDATAVSVDTDTVMSGNQNTLTFTAGGDGSDSGAGNGNWAVPQTVTVRALNDVDSANENFNITHTATAASGPYNGIAVDRVAVTITDAGHGVLLSK